MFCVQKTKNVYFDTNQIIWTQMTNLSELVYIYYKEELKFEFDLIDSVQQILLDYPHPHLERTMRNFEMYFHNMGETHFGYYELISNAYEHLCTETKKTLMASRIKRQFKRSMTDPNYKMCRDRLNKEFTSLSNSINAA